MHDISILDDILLAFKTELSCFLDLQLTAVLEKVVAVVNLSADETFLEIRMDYSSVKKVLSPSVE